MHVIFSSLPSLEVERLAHTLINHAVVMIGVIPTDHPRQAWCNTISIGCCELISHFNFVYGDVAILL